MGEPSRGLPLLSGPPPPTDSQSAEIACRKCNKEFNIIFARARRCNHCGYSYCHNCSDFQALMPRTGNDSTGYDSVNVCGFCIEFLTITAGGKSYLKSLPLSKLKKYINAYNIKINGAVEKDDLIEAIINARGPNGCLYAVNESFYRKYSVPNRTTGQRPRGLFSRPGQSSSSSSVPPPPPPRPPPQPAFARPDLAPDYPLHHQYAPPPGPPPPHQHQQHYQAPPPPHPEYSTYPSVNAHMPTQFQQYPPPPPNGYGIPPYGGVPLQPQPGYNPHYAPNVPGYQPQYNPYYPAPPPPPQNTRPTQRRQTQQQHTAASQSSSHIPNSHQPPPAPPRPRTTSAATPTPPSLDELLDMSQDAISALSIGALKSVLFTNHVNAGLILEKSDLVQKVLTLVEDERRERDRQRAIEEAERLEREERKREQQERRDREQAERDHRENFAEDSPGSTAAGNSEGGSGSGSSSSSGGRSTTPSTPGPAPPLPPKQQAMQSLLERTGLCVICQDEEANIAIVDCGHLAMCRGCSDLVMASTKECPLCRTRIVTEARLLRIFKT